MNLTLRERENWFENFYKPFWREKEFFNYSVPIDLKENEDSYVLKADLPGLEEKEVKVEYDNRVLIISGERKQKNKQENDSYYNREISYGKFSRSFRFNDDLKDSDIKAKFKNGVLEVTLPKKESEKPKLIPFH